MSNVNQIRQSAPGFDPRLFLRDEELDYGIALLLAGERALIAASGALAKTHKIPPLAARILLALRFQPGQTVQALRQQLGATPPTLARLLAELDRREWLERRRCPQDGRRRLLYLGVEGARVTDPATLAMRQRLRQAYRKAGPNAVAGARAVLEALI